MLLCCSSNSEFTSRWSTVLSDDYPLASVNSLQSLAYHLKNSHPDIILLHLNLPGLHGINGAIELRRQFPLIRFLIFADDINDLEALTLLKFGIQGYAQTNLPTMLIAKAVKSIIQGELWYCRKWMQRVLESLARINLEHVDDNQMIGLEKLTEREKQIAHFVADGASNKVIASNLHLSERTIKAHMTSVFKKTKTHNRLEVALLINSQIEES